MKTPSTNWNALKRVPDSYMPRAWQAWVLDRGSLTRRLQQASKNHFAVRVLRQGFDRPSVNERLTLGLGSREVALIREVELVCYDQVWVTARSVIPVKTLSGEERQLAGLGTKPLGAYLFASRTMRRGPLELARTRVSGRTSFARRSVFRLHGKPLLVMEHFQPIILDRHLQQDHHLDAL